MFTATRVATRVAARPVAAAVRSTVATPIVQARAMSSATTNSTAGVLYRLVFKRNATYVAFIVAGAIVAGGVYESFMDTVFTAYNKGVRRRHAAHTRAV